MIDIKKIIKKSGLSDLKMSRLSGVNRSTIFRIRTKDFDPKLSTVNKILEVIDNENIQK